MILSSKYEMQKNFVIDSLGVKISRWGGQNIVRYFDPQVELG